MKRIKISLLLIGLLVAAGTQPTRAQDACAGCPLHMACGGPSGCVASTGVDGRQACIYCDGTEVYMKNGTIVLIN